MKDVYVIGGAVAAAGSTSERERGHQIVVNRAERADGSRRIHDDPPRIDHVTKLADNFIVARENDCRMSQSSGMVHVHTHPKRLSDGLGSIDSEYRKQLLDRQRMFAAYSVNRCNQQLGVWLNGKTDKAGD